MINKKKILEELYEFDPSLKLEEEKTEKLVTFFSNHNPNIETPKAFKIRLGNKLNTIGEFKQIQPSTKFNFMQFLKPLFLLVVGLFILTQFQNYLSMKEVNMRTSPEIQNLEMSVSDDLDTSIGESEEDQIDGLGESEQEIITEVSLEQSQESIGNIDIPSNKTKTIESSSGDSDNYIEVAEESPADQDSLEKNDNREEGNSDVQSELNLNEQGDSFEESQDSSESTTGASFMTSTDEADFLPEESQDEESQDTIESLSTSTISPQNDDNTPEEIKSESSSEENYYTCEDGKIVIDDSIAQRRIIKSYCDSVGGEIINGGGNIKYYLCTLSNQDEVGIEYIEKELCK